MTDTDLRDRMAAAIRADLQLAVPPWEPIPGVKLSPGMGRTEFDLADAALHVAQAELDRLATERDSVYRERAQLVAHLAALYPSHIGYTDPDVPTWPVLTVEAPTGQMCWHVNPADLDLFGHIVLGNLPDDARSWDGHTTEEKYQRLRKLTSQDAAERLRRERATCRRCTTGDHDPCGQHLRAR